MITSASFNMSFHSKAACATNTVSSALARMPRCCYQNLAIAKILVRKCCFQKVKKLSENSTSIRLTALAMLCVLLLGGSLCLAEPERGRLPDGRAYRTGAEGVQLVDYMAELELSVEELTRRIHGLEAELEAKQQRIDRFERTGSGEPVLKERDLLGNEAVGHNACPQPAPCPVCAAGQTEARVFDPELVRKQHRCEADLEGARIELSRSRQELMQAQSQLSVARQQPVAADSSEVLKQRSLEGRVADLEAEKAKLQSELAAQNLKRTGQIAEEKTAMLPLSVPVPPQEGPRASLAPATIQEGRVASDRLSAARAQALSSLKSTLQSNLNQLRGLIAERDRKFKEYGPQLGPVRFKLSALESSRRYTIDAVRQGITAAQSMSELSAYDRDIRDIRIKVKDDIGFIDRMKKRH